MNFRFKGAAAGASLTPNELLLSSKPTGGVSVIYQDSDPDPLANSSSCNPISRYTPNPYSPSWPNIVDLGCIQRGGATSADDADQVYLTNWVIVDGHSNPATAKDFVTILDLLAVRNHILGISTITEPFTKIAADINSDAQIDIVDLANIRSVIIEATTDYPQGPVWKFLPDGVLFNCDANEAPDYSRVPSFSEFGEVFVNDPFSSSIGYPNYFDFHLMEYGRNYNQTDDRVANFYENTIVTIKMGDIDKSSLSGLPGTPAEEFASFIDGDSTVHEINTRADIGLYYANQTFDSSYVAQGNSFSLDIGQSAIQGLDLKITLDPNVSIGSIDIPSALENSSLIIDFHINNNEMNLVIYDSLANDFTIPNGNAISINTIGSGTMPYEVKINELNIVSNTGDNVSLHLDSNIHAEESSVLATSRSIILNDTQDIIKGFSIYDIHGRKIHERTGLEVKQLDHQSLLNSESIGLYYFHIHTSSGWESVAVTKL